MPNNTFSPFAEILTAIGQGRDIQFKSALDGQWAGVLTSDVLRAISNNSADATFLRVKPDTLRIGGVEVAAPLREAPKVGEGYFYFELDSGFFVWEGDDRDIALFKQGTTFRTAGELGDAMSAVLELFALKD